jgi:hypothetical protein
MNKREVTTSAAEKKSTGACHISRANTAFSYWGQFEARRCDGRRRPRTMGQGFGRNRHRLCHVPRANSAFFKVGAVVRSNQEAA